MTDTEPKQAQREVLKRIKAHAERCRDANWSQGGLEIAFEMIALLAETLAGPDE